VAWCLGQEYGSASWDAREVSSECLVYATEMVFAVEKAFGRVKVPETLTAGGSWVVGDANLEAGDAMKIVL
jgi:hypothetical protein